MKPDENYHSHPPSHKRSRLGNVGLPANLGGKVQQHQDDDDEDGGERRNGGVAAPVGVGSGRSIVPWQHGQFPSSRIYRVSRASGGKDRHSKVYTAKGLRDRRVRLSVTTAIQFYDLQDRLGYDQPSKAIEWLIKAASKAINELPALVGFPKPPQPEGEGKPLEANLEVDPGYDQQQQQQHMPTKSGCSSTSETSKGSVLTLSRSECRVKARERARERAAKDKEKDRDEGGSHVVSAHHRNITPSLNSQTSFTELLSGGGAGAGGRGSNGATLDVVATNGDESSPICIQKQMATADYFTQAGLFSQNPKLSHQLSSGFSSHSQFGGNSVYSMMPFNIAAAGNPAAAADHQEMQQFSFLQDHLIPAPSVTPTGDYNLNFSISSGLAGFNRGTLQSNSPSQMSHHRQHNHGQSHLQRFSSPVDGANLPFFFGAAAASGPVATTNTGNQYPPGFDGRLQLCYGDGFRHSDLKGKGKS